MQNPHPSAKRALKARFADERTSNCLAVATERLAKQETRHLPTRRIHFRNVNAGNPDPAVEIRAATGSESGSRQSEGASHFLSFRKEALWRRATNDSDLERRWSRCAQNRREDRAFSPSEISAFHGAAGLPTRTKCFCIEAAWKRRSRGLTRQGASPGPWAIEERGCRT